MTPTVLRSGPYRLFFYSNDQSEPMHVHIRRDKSEAKFWLDPVSLAINHGLGQQELNRVEAIVIENRERLIEAWNEFFSD